MDEYPRVTIKDRTPIPEENVKVVIGRVGGYSYRNPGAEEIAKEFYKDKDADTKWEDVSEEHRTLRVKAFESLLEKFQITQRLLDNKPTTPYNDMIKRK